MTQRLKWQTFVDRNFNWRYIDWQSHLLEEEMYNSKFRKFTKSFTEETVEYKAIYPEMLAFELESRVNQESEYFVSYRTILSKYKVTPSNRLKNQLRNNIQSEIDQEVEALILNSIEAIPKLPVDIKDPINNMFAGLITFSEKLESRYGLTISSKLKNKLHGKKEIEEKTEDDTPKESKKDKKAKFLKSNSELTREYVNLSGTSLSLQVLLFTMLSKTKMWLKLLKNPSATKKNRVEFLTDWFWGFKEKFKKYILLDSCPYSQDIKELRNLRTKIYTNFENTDRIFELADLKNYQELKLELNKGYDINMKNGKKKLKTLMHVAAVNQDMELLELVLSFGADINAVERKLMTPLFYAIENRDHAMVRRLLELGTDVHVRDEHNATPFYYAVYCAGVELLKLLVQFGADPAVTCMMNRNCLLKACFMDKSDVVEYLLTFESVRAMINQGDDRGRTPLHASCWGAKGGRDGKKLLGQEIPDSKDSLKLLLDAGADVR